MELQVFIRAYSDADYQCVAEILDQSKLVDPERDNRDCLSRKIERDHGSILVATCDGRGL